MMSASFQRSLQLFASGSTAAGIKSERMAHLFGLAPPIDEQSVIVKYVREHISHLDTVIDPVERSIDKLRELRKGLITEAVTGQIDVSAWSRNGQFDRLVDKAQEAMRA